MNNVIDTIKSRRSIRAYKDEQLSRAELEAILEAGTYAPSGMNKQPWLFSVVQNKLLLENINNIATHGDNFKNVFYNAPTLIVVSCDNTEAVSPQEDAALAIGNMFLAAESLGIGSCWIYSVQNALNEPYGRSLKAALDIPENNIIYATGAFGYKGCKNPPASIRKEGVIRFIE